MNGDHLIGRRTVAGTPGIQRRVDGRARVHDEDVTGREVARQVASSSMPNAVVIRVRDEETDLVSREAARLRRLVGDERVGQCEVQLAMARAGRGARRARGAHAATAPATAAAISDATYRPLGKSPSSTATNPGTFDSGRGR